MKFVVALLLVVVLLLQYRLWFADGGRIEVYNLGAEIAYKQAQVDDLKVRNGALEAEVEDLKQGLDAIEARARSELGMIREDETFFQVIEPAEDGPRR